MNGETAPHVPEPPIVPITFAGRDYDARLAKRGPTFELRPPDGTSKHVELPGFFVVEIPVDAANAGTVKSSPAVKETLEDDPGQLVAVLTLQVADETILDSIRKGSYVGPRLNFDLYGRRRK